MAVAVDHHTAAVVGADRRAVTEGRVDVVVPQVAASDTVPVVFSLNGVVGTQNLVIAITN